MGCFAYCSGPGSAMDGRCASVGCCGVDIAPGLTDNVVSFEDWPHDGMDFSPCDIAFLVDKDGYDFRASDLRMDVERTSMPVWLDWAIRDESALTCATARNNTRYGCVSANSECVDSANVPGYFCNASKGSRATRTKSPILTNAHTLRCILATAFARTLKELTIASAPQVT
ncbi:hypothetical protein GQ55_2G105000 [Panicum hallii var. hallii]|uniref:Wall-associated receptor kinase galacturonan-binding domain-containing protein n=1 Tax=Panicum hallii var. hallii TaxID=1504633 RepID=A0A2T7ENK0_9POAL|nr:hypothetical protein GQ55_2G105000 [Panicum hallii var. hallii]